MGWVGRHEYRCMPGCRGEASGNGITGEPAHLMPDAHLHCTKRSAVQVSPLQNTGIASAAPRNDRGGRHRTPLLARRGRSVHGLTSPSPRIDLPLPTDPIPVFCRGEASSMRCLGSTVMPFQDASPLPHGTRRGALPLRADHSGCHCKAQPKQSGDFQKRDCHAPCGGSQ